MKCYRCGFPNESGARFCNNCAAPVSNIQSTKKNPIWVFALIGILGLCVLSGIVSKLGSKSPQDAPAPVSTPSPEARWNSDSGKIEAYTMAKNFMEIRLKSPASANFPWYSSSDVNIKHQGHGVFVVQAYVDSQNSFGAQIRTRYTCELKDNGETWSLVSLHTTP